MKRRFWTDEEIEVLRERYADTPTREIAQQLGRTETSTYQKALNLGLRKSEQYLSSEAACRLDGEVGAACRFEKGHAPHNKGKKGWKAGGRAKETQFKAGHRGGKAAALYQPIGSERLTKDGYLQRKVNDEMPFQKRWKMVHNLEWEKHNGPIPKGHIVTFRNGNKRDFSPENLELISRAENMRRNTIHRYPPELKQTIRLVGKLRRTISEKQD